VHTRTLVLLRAVPERLWDAVGDQLRPHRLDEEHPTKRWTHDYWSIGEGTIGDAATIEQYGLQTQEAGQHVCLVSRLPKDYVPGAILTPEGSWYDLFDHGWRLMDDTSLTNRRALDEWRVQVRELLDTYHDCLAIEVDTHS
jgi:hypothetical protein